MPAPASPAPRAVAAAPSACVCWRVGTVPHAGHCCFDGSAEAYQGDPVLPPCGHWYPVLPITDAAIRAVNVPGTELGGTEVAGSRRGVRGLWVELRRRRRQPGAEGELVAPARPLLRQRTPLQDRGAQGGVDKLHHAAGRPWMAGAGGKHNYVGPRPNTSSTATVLRNTVVSNPARASTRL